MIQPALGLKVFQLKNTVIQSVQIDSPLYEKQLTPAQNGGQPYGFFVFKVKIYMGGTSVVTESFHFSTDRFGAGLEGFPVKKYCFPFGSHTL